MMIKIPTMSVDTNGNNLNLMGKSASASPSFRATFSNLFTGEGVINEASVSTSEQLKAFLSVWFDQQSEEGQLLENLEQELAAIPVEELELTLDFEWDELMTYLTELEQELSETEDALGHEALLALLQQIPVQLIDKLQSETDATREQRTVLEQMPAFVQKWATLLRVYENKDQTLQTRLDPVQFNELSQQLQNIVQQIQSNSQRVQFFQQQMIPFTEVQNLLSLRVAQVQKTEQPSQLQTPTFLPQSWLTGKMGTEDAGEHQPVLPTATDNLIRHTDAERPLFAVQDLTAKFTADPSVQDKPAAQQPVVRFSQILEDLTQIFRAQLNKGNEQGTQLRVKLHPEHLGHLDIRITSLDGKITAQIMTGTKVAKEALELTVGQLRTSLVQQGIQVEKIEVSHQAQQHHQSNFSDSRSNHQSFGQHSQHHNGNESSLGSDDQLSYAAELQRIEDQLVENENENEQSPDLETNASINLVV